MKKDRLFKGLSLLIVLLAFPAIILIPTVFLTYMFSFEIDLENTFLAIWSEVWLHAHAGQPSNVANLALSFDIAGCLFLLFSVVSFFRSLQTGERAIKINSKVGWREFPGFIFEEPSFFTYRFVIVTILTVNSIIINEIFWPSLNFLDQWFLALLLLFIDKLFIQGKIRNRL